MGVEYTNDCMDCAVPGYPCLGSSCPNLNVPHYYCDGCGEEESTLYSYDEREYCEDCLIEELMKSGLVKRFEPDFD